LAPYHYIYLNTNSPLCGAQRRKEGLGVSPSMANVPDSDTPGVVAPCHPEKGEQP